MAHVRDPRTGRKVYIPTPEEDAEINRGIAEDPDAFELDAAWFAKAKPTSEVPELVEILTRHGKWGRPPLPPEDRKKRVTLHLDPDILARLKAEGKGWQTRANAALRKALGL